MASRTQKLDLRLTPEAKQILYAAALAANRSVSDFVLKEALARATEVLADRQRFNLNETQWAEFMAALDAPVRALPRTQRLLQEASVFEPGKATHDPKH